MSKSLVTDSYCRWCTFTAELLQVQQIYKMGKTSTVQFEPNLEGVGMASHHDDFATIFRLHIVDERTHPGDHVVDGLDAEALIVCVDLIDWPDHVVVDEGCSMQRPETTFPQARRDVQRKLFFSTCLLLLFFSLFVVFTLLGCCVQDFVLKGQSSLQGRNALLCRLTSTSEV